MDSTGSPPPRTERTSRHTSSDNMESMPSMPHYNGQDSQRSNKSVRHSAAKISIAAPSGHSTDDTSPVDLLLARLSESSAILTQQKLALSSSNIDVSIGYQREADRTGGNSAPITPANVPSRGSDPSTGSSDASEMRRLKQQLEAANSKIAKMDEEMSQNRITKHTLDQAMGSASEYDFPLTQNSEEAKFPSLTNSFASLNRPISRGKEHWATQEDGNSDNSDSYLVEQPVSRNGPTAWARGPRSGLNNAHLATLPAADSLPLLNNHWNTARSYLPTGHGSILGAQNLPGYQASMRGAPAPLPIDNFRGNGNYMNDTMHHQTDRRTFQPATRPNSAMGPRFLHNGYGSTLNTAVAQDGHGLTPPMTPLTPMFPYQQSSMYSSHGVFQPGVGPAPSRLSPTAAEFSVRASYGRNDPWNAQAASESGTTYISPTEPINYRRLLDRNMSCNWSYIVDKIVRSNDQQASIFLQQKLKSCTSDQKYEIIDAIIAQAYPLMINRFGNFLIQRCFEHGSPEQIIAIANAIRGNTLTLSMDPFGCHVVQKAFDSVPEEYKAIMVHELLRRIPETVVHRYACHVWQKLFELRWSDSPPQIMKYVNEALRGMWHEVALGETGSLVVQNIFENCLEEDKRPCINEVLASIDVVAHGQFGNWCIQHICEHGEQADRNRATDHILRFATEYSMDQYASKVIEKCLKIGGTDFLDRYLDRLCEVRPDRPRIPLIDIAGDQFGNYLIQWVLQSAPSQHREIVASHVRKHMVSLRGSKYGSRVAMLCCQPQFATRPGVPSGMQINRFNSNNSSTRSNSFGTYR